MSNARRPHLVLLAIGIPGAGKTTLLRPLAERYALQFVNRDEIREEWFGEPHVQAAKELVWQEAEGRMRDALAAGQPVVLDSTFTRRAKRAGTIASARAAGAERVVGILFDTPPEIAKEQNADREHQVREEVIDSMHAQLENEPPSLEEGFDALYTHEQLRELEENELQEA